MDREILCEYGIDYDKGLHRCMDDPVFYEKFLLMFLGDSTFLRAKEAFSRRDYVALFDDLHELKGVSGNIAMTELYAAVCPLVELLRDGSPSEAAIAPLFSAVEAAYAHACRGISLATESR